MPVSFRFEEFDSSLFGKIKRPVAKVYFLNIKDRLWKGVTMLIDTGADYTLLPKYMSNLLSINLSKDCRPMTTRSVGADSKVYFMKEKMKIKIGDMERLIPLGFSESDFIPPLMGRKECFETFTVTFKDFTVTFA